jgi:hypothetical protein
MTKGDTLRVQLSLTDCEGYKYIPDEGDRIRFAMKKNYSDQEPLILKQIPIDSLLLTLNPDDTKNLEAPASYVYDIEITYANGDVDTFIDKAKLMLTQEVY